MRVAAYGVYSLALSISLCNVAIARNTRNNSSQFDQIKLSFLAAARADDVNKANIFLNSKLKISAPPRDEKSNGKSFDDFLFGIKNCTVIELNAYDDYFNKWYTLLSCEDSLSGYVEWKFRKNRISELSFGYLVPVVVKRK